MNNAAVPEIETVKDLVDHLKGWPKNAPLRNEAGQLVKLDFYKGTVIIK